MGPCYWADSRCSWRVSQAQSGLPPGRQNGTLRFVVPAPSSRGKKSWNCQMRPTWAGWGKGPESLCPRLDLVHKLVVPGLGLCKDKPRIFCLCYVQPGKKIRDNALLLDCLPVACISISGFKCGLPKAVECFIKNKTKAELHGKDKKSRDIGIPLPTTHLLGSKQLCWRSLPRKVLQG